MTAKIGEFGVPEFQSSRVPEFQCSRVQSAEFQSSRVPVFGVGSSNNRKNHRIDPAGGKNTCEKNNGNMYQTENVKSELGTLELLNPGTD